MDVLVGHERLGHSKPIGGLHTFVLVNSWHWITDSSQISRESEDKEIFFWYSCISFIYWQFQAVKKNQQQKHETEKNHMVLDKN